MKMLETFKSSTGSEQIDSPSKILSSGQPNSPIKRFEYALAALPRHSNVEEIAHTLPRLKSIGYTGIWVENNYLDPESLNDAVANPEFAGNWDLFNLFDLTLGKKRALYLPYLQSLAALCQKEGLDFCLSFWVPRVNPEMLTFLRAHHPSALGLSHAHLEENVPCLCTCRDGGGLDLLTLMVRQLFQDIPGLWGLKVSTEDNHALLCDTNCPNAHGSTRAEHAGNLFATIETAMLACQPQARLLLYPWFWREGYEEQIIPRLQGSYLIVTKYESGSLQNLETNIPAEPIFDSSLVSEKPGVGFERWRSTVGAERLIDMVPTGTGIDDFFLSNPPYPARLFRRLRALRQAGVRSFMDFECGGFAPGSAGDIVAAFAREETPEEAITLQKIAADRSSDAEAQRHTLRGWEAFDKGFGLLPIGLGKTEQALFSGRVGFAWSLSVATPLLPHLLGGDRQHDLHWFSPYNFFTPLSASRLGLHFLRVLTHWQTAATALAQASALAPRSEMSTRDAVSAEAHVISLTSVLHWALAPSLQATNPAVFADLMRSEIETTQRFAELVKGHPWVWANHCWHPHQTPLSQRLGLGSIPGGTDAFSFKIQTMHSHLRP